MASEIDARRTELRAEHRRRNRHRGRPSVTVLRLAELSRLFAARYGVTLPDDDAGRDDAAIMMNYLAQLPGDQGARLTAWASTHAPWLQGDELAAAIDTATAGPRIHKADELGAMLGLTDAERTRLHISTIGPIDVSKRERAKRRLARKRLAETARRRARGARPRKDYETTALSHLKPWKRAGISRATWYRRQHSRQTGETSAWTA